MYTHSLWARISLLLPSSILLISNSKDLLKLITESNIPEHELIHFNTIVTLEEGLFATV